MKIERIREWLSNGDDVFIKFTKKDGTARVLIATPKIPKKDRPKSSSEAPAMSYIRVYEEGSGWRTVLEESIQEYRSIGKS